MKICLLEVESFTNDYRFQWDSLLNTIKYQLYHFFHNLPQPWYCKCDVYGEIESQYHDTLAPIEFQYSGWYNEPDEHNHPLPQLMVEVAEREKGTFDCNRDKKTFKQRNPNVAFVDHSQSNKTNNDDVKNYSVIDIDQSSNDIMNDDIMNRNDNNITEQVSPTLTMI